jgi:Bacterial SH3 domain
MRLLSSLTIATLIAAAACKLPPPAGSAPPARDTARVRPIPPSSRPVVLRDTALEQRTARLELTLLEKEAQLEEMQARLDDARREVVRAMAKLQSLATRAEAASGMAEAEIALQALRSSLDETPSSEAVQAAELLQLASGEFDKQNYAGALYLATQAKNAASSGQGRLGSGDRGTPRAGEIPFALPLRIETTSRANVREGPGAAARVLFTLEQGTPLIAYSYLDQWVRIRDGTDRAGWIHQGLIGGRRR